MPQVQRMTLAIIGKCHLKQSEQMKIEKGLHTHTCEMAAIPLHLH